MPDFDPSRPDAVRARLNYEAFYSEFLQLHGRGDERRAFCPFHENTDTEALGVNVRTGLWLCRNPVCAARGDVFDFYQRRTGASFPEALAELERRAGTGPPPPSHRNGNGPASAGPTNAPEAGAEAARTMNAAQASIRRSVVVVRLSDVEPEEVRFVWRPRIPRGKVTLLEGDPSDGKTWLSLWLAARITTGSRFEADPDVDEAVRMPANAIYMTAEDGIADTIRPRFELLGGDPSRLYLLNCTAREDGTDERLIQLAMMDDLQLLAAVMEAKRPRLVVVDPLQGFLGADVDMNKANEVRPVMTYVGALAQQFDCAVLLIRHLAKGAALKAAYRGLGSIDFTAAARSVLMTGRDPEDRERRVLMHIKSNLAVAGGTLAYKLGAEGLEWLGRSNVTPNAVLGPERDGPPVRALDEAQAWLREALSDGPAPVPELKQRARRDGIAWRTLERAKEALGVTSHRPPGSESWSWTMPVTGMAAPSVRGGAREAGARQSCTGRTVTCRR